jgi:hypothetical protein
MLKAYTLTLIPQLPSTAVSTAVSLLHRLSSLIPPACHAVPPGGSDVADHCVAVGKDPAVDPLLGREGAEGDALAVDGEVGRH